jgi:predicted P-loop ATPase
VDVDFDHSIDMQQFWSEIAQLWRAGGKWWLDGEDLQLLNSHNSDFEVVDPYREAILNAFCWQPVEEFSKPMTSTQICEAIGYHSPDKRTATAVGKALNKLGLVSVKKSIAGQQARYFMMPEIK